MFISPGELVIIHNAHRYHMRRCRKQRRESGVSNQCARTRRYRVAHACRFSAVILHAACLSRCSHKRGARRLGAVEERSVTEGRHFRDTLALPSQILRGARVAVSVTSSYSAVIEAIQRERYAGEEREGVEECLSRCAARGGTLRSEKVLRCSPLRRSCGASCRCLPFYTPRQPPVVFDRSSPEAHACCCRFVVASYGMRC